LNIDENEERMRKIAEGSTVGDKIEKNLNKISKKSVT
jgi:hypothetical protein